MKKIFNLAVVFAALMTAVSFSSCAGDEEDAIDKAEEQSLAYVQVKDGDKVYFANSSVGDGKGGVIEITTVTTSETDKVVNFKLATKKDEQKKVEFTIGQSGSNPSYVLWDGTEFKTGMQADATANPDQVIFCLASNPSELNSSLAKSACVLTSATVNNKVKEAAKSKGITLVETQFGVK